MKISAIVPAYNEEKKIKQVIETLLKSSLIQEIICVNDGSTDNTLKILKSLGKKITVINLKKNYGKGYALATGIEKANGTIIAFFDADLIHFSEAHIKMLVTPLLDNKPNIRTVLGYPTGKPPKYIYTLYKKVTGERAYKRRDLLPHLSYMAKTRMGVEIYLNSLFSKQETKIIPLNNLCHILKTKKHGMKKGILDSMQGMFEAGKEMKKQTIKKPPLRWFFASESS